MSIPRLIAVAKGDGIGPEIMDTCLSIFKTAKLPLSFQVVEMGYDTYKKGFSNGMTPEAQATVEKLGILYKGPMMTPKGGGVKSINVTARKVWNTYANKRIYQSLPGIFNTPYAKCGIPVSLCLIRENIEDVYGAIEHTQTNDVVQCRRLITRPGSLQVHRYAFEIAKTRGAKRITCGHKANIMKITDGLFLETFYEVAKDYPELKADDVIIDDLCMKLVMQPENFDVIVSTNLQGDIVSDLAAGLVGGLGLCPSSNVGDHIRLFEAVHGTAPDIAGKGIANPTALFLSGLMMLRHVGLSAQADHLQTALLATLKDGYLTKDVFSMGTKNSKPLSTSDFGQAIVDHFPAELKSTNKIYFDEHAHPMKAPLKQNILHATPRNLANEKTIGIDIFVDASMQPKDLAAIISKNVPANSGLTFTMISNRGTQVWPTGSVYTELVNHFRVRFESKTETAQTESDLLAIAANLAKSIRVCSLEMLRMVNGKKGFSLAQGQ